jgi:hypothetical protein
LSRSLWFDQSPWSYKFFVSKIARVSVNGKWEWPFESPCAPRLFWKYQTTACEIGNPIKPIPNHKYFLFTFCLWSTAKRSRRFANKIKKFVFAALYGYVLAGHKMISLPSIKKQWIVVSTINKANLFYQNITSKIKKQSHSLKKFSW